MNLVDLTVLMSEVALATMWAHFGRKERFAVFVTPASDFFGLEGGGVSGQFVVSVCELAGLSVTAGVVLNDVLAKLCLVLGGGWFANSKI